MSGTETIKMLEKYEQGAPPSSFFTAQFQTPDENIHETESVEIDIERSDEDVAIAIQDLSTGPRMNTDDIYTNKKFTPPIFDEAFTLNIFDLIKRVGGQHPFTDPIFQANATLRFFKGMRKCERKIRRAIEWQAAQVLQTGTTTLIDSAGNSLYTVDYKPKATHFFNASPVWDGVSPTIAKDIIKACELVRDDGQRDPDMVQMGALAWEVALADPDFIGRFDTRRADIGRISMMRMDDTGGQYRGILDLGNYQLEVWTYNGKFKHPQTGTITSFLDPIKVIVRASTGRLDGTYGAIPSLFPPDRRILPYLPERVRSGQIDMTPNAWISPNNRNMFGSVGTRPLMIPTAIDTFVTINTGITP